jgi:hypothetical protein
MSLHSEEIMESLSKSRKQILEEERTVRKQQRELKKKEEETLRAQKAEARRLKAEEKQRALEERRSHPLKRGRPLINLSEEEKLQRQRERQDRQADYYQENKDKIISRITEYNKTYKNRYTPRTGGKVGRPRKEI